MDKGMMLDPHVLSRPLAQRISHEVEEAILDLERLHALGDTREWRKRQDMLHEKIREACAEALEAHDKMLAHFQKELTEILVIKTQPLILDASQAETWFDPESGQRATFILHPMGEATRIEWIKCHPHAIHTGVGPVPRIVMEEFLKKAHASD